MEKLVAYKMTVEEAENKLQDWLDDSGLHLIPSAEDGYYEAKSSSQELDGAEVDDRFSEILGVEVCENYIAETGGIIIVVMKG